MKNWLPSQEKLQAALVAAEKASGRNHIFK